eukprot:m.99273 g.99273  ORF g.99273 m.99273 type:complete len:382 (-) comp8715_c1_seq4:116-1261(-)
MSDRADLTRFIDHLQKLRRPALRCSALLGHIYALVTCGPCVRAHPRWELPLRSVASFVVMGALLYFENLFVIMAMIGVTLFFAWTLLRRGAQEELVYGPQELQRLFKLKVADSENIEAALEKLRWYSFMIAKLDILTEHVLEGLRIASRVLSGRAGIASVLVYLAVTGNIIALWTLPGHHAVVTILATLYLFGGLHRLQLLPATPPAAGQAGDPAALAPVPPQIVESTRSTPEVRTPSLEPRAPSAPAGLPHTLSAASAMTAKSMPPAPRRGPDASPQRRQQCAACGASFGIFKPRQYCRHCGNGFCSSCCKYKVPRSAFGATAPSAARETVRVCHDCHEHLLTLTPLTRPQEAADPQEPELLDLHSAVNGLANLVRPEPR